MPNGGTKTHGIIMAASPRQIAFVEEYIKDCNATQAAIRAGYSVKAARQVARRLLTYDHIQAKINEYRQKSETEAVLSLAEAREILSEIARAKVADYFDSNGKIAIEKLKAVRPGAIEGIKQTMDGRGNPVIQIKLVPKIAAIERLAKLSGWDAPEKMEHSGVVYSVELPDDIPTPAEGPPDDRPDPD